jgi:hypothetical protein
MNNIERLGSFSELANLSCLIKPYQHTWDQLDSDVVGRGPDVGHAIFFLVGLFDLGGRLVDVVKRGLLSGELLDILCLIDGLGFGDLELCAALHDLILLFIVLDTMYTFVAFGERARISDIFLRLFDTADESSDL